MGNVILVDPAEDSCWDSFVEHHPFGLICHLSGWKRVLEKTFGHIKGYYLALWDDANNDIRAALPVFEVRSWLTGNRLVSVPFASVCDPLISSSDEMRTLLESALDLSAKLGTSRIEIRTLSSSSFVQDHRFGVSCFYKHHYLLLDGEPEELEMTFHRTCVRQRIRRAANSGLDLKVCDSECDLRRFYQLHLMTRKRLGLPLQPYAFFQLLWREFASLDRISLLLAERKGEAIAGLILLKFRDRVSAEFVATDASFRDVSPNHFLFWEAIKQAYRQGYNVFDFGRTWSQNIGLMDFKGHWGTRVVDLPEFHYPRRTSKGTANREEHTPYRAARSVCKNAPDNAQALIGSLLYRHLG